MNLRRRHRILEAGKSPSLMAMERTYKRAILNGGVTQDFSANIENIREISRKLGYDICNGRIVLRKNISDSSEDFTTAIWIKELCTVTPNLDNNPVNSALTVSKITVLTASSVNRIRKASSVTTSSNLTVSIYLKKIDLPFVHIRTSGVSQEVGVCVDLTNKTLLQGYYDGTFVMSLPLVRSIIDVGNGYMRVSFKLENAPANFIMFYLSNSSINSNATTVGQGFYMYGFQLEEGSLATSYQRTTLNGAYDNTANNPATFIYVPSSYGEGKNFAQVQNIRNILQWSEDLTQSQHIKTNVTVSSNTNLNPFGKNQSYYVLDNTTNGIHNITQSNSVVSGLTYSATFYVKKAQDTWCQFLLGFVNFGTNTVWANFNFDTGLFGNIGSNTTWRAETLINGYYKLTVTAIAIASTSNTSVGIFGTNNTNSVVTPSYIGTGRQVCDIAALQFETGRYTTPYQKTVALGDGIVDFNFTRATSARVTNKLGVIEDSCYNLLTNSENQTIQAANNLTRTANNTSSPIGTLTGTLLIPTITNGLHNLRIAGNNIQNTAYVYSGYVKTAGEPIVLIVLDDGAASNIRLTCNMTTGVSSLTPTGSSFTSTSSRFIPDKNGWWYFEIIYTNSATSANFQNIYLKQILAYAGDGINGIYTWGLQNVQGSTPRPYLRTTNRLNVPKLDYSRGLGEPELLIEPQRTNLLRQSEGFTTVSWTLTAPNITRITNALLSPEETLTATKITENTSSSAQIINQVRLSLPANVISTAFVYVKAGERNLVSVQLGTSGAFDGAKAIFDLSNGTISSPVILVGSATTPSAKITHIVNGWYKCEVSCFLPTTTTYGIFIAIRKTNDYLDYAGTTGFGIYIWGAQLENGSNGTSLITTTSVATIRNVDNSYTDLFNNASLNRTNWTLCYEGFLYDAVATTPFLCLSDTTTAATNTNQIGFIGAFQPFYNIANVRTNGVAGTTNNTFNRFAIQYNNGIANFYLNGVNVFSNKSVPIFDYRYLVLNSGGNTFTVQKLELYNRTMTNEECILLTT